MGKRCSIYVLMVAVAVMAGKCPAAAQFSDSLHYHIGYTATGIFNQTSTSNSFVLSNAARFNINKTNRFLNSGVAWVYGRQNGRQTNNDLSSFVNYDRYVGWPHFYCWGLLAYEKSYSLKVNDRFQGGLGLGYNIADKPVATVVLSDGMLYEYGDLIDASGLRNSYNAIRNSLRLKYHFVLKEIIVFDGIHYWQQSVAAGDDYILKSNSSLSVKLKKWLSITSVLNYNRVNRTNSKNLLFTFGFAAEHYF